MQRLGQIMNRRDERNWMVPRQGTVRRKVYEALIAGKPAGLIMKELGLSRASYNSHRHCIVSWECANRNSYKVRTFRRYGDTFMEVSA